VGIGRLSPTHETRLLGDEAEMLLIAVATRLGNRKGAFVDVFGLALSRRSSAPLLAGFVTALRSRSRFFQ
jgi:hypothetical protein